MSEARPSVITINEPSTTLAVSAPLATGAQPSATPDSGPTSAALTIPREERILASASYFSALSGMWLVVPGAIYLWRGRHSRFVAFHAVQAVLLQVALIPIAFVGVGIASALSALVMVVGGKVGVVASGFVLYSVSGIAMAGPTGLMLWLGFGALRGKPRALPLLSRWTHAILRDL